MSAEQTSEQSALSTVYLDGSLRDRRFTTRWTRLVSRRLSCCRKRPDSNSPCDNYSNGLRSARCARLRTLQRSLAYRRRGFPPPLPPSGPRSTIQSAVLITSGLCSATTMVFALIAKLMQNVEQLLDIRKVQTGGRLIENVQRLPAYRVWTTHAPASRAALHLQRAWSLTAPDECRSGLRPSASAAYAPAQARHQRTRASSMVISSTS